MSEFIAQIAGFLTAFGWVGPALVTLVVAGLVLWQYFRRVFDDQIVYGINFFDGETLQLRTLQSVPRDDIMTRNRIFQTRLRRAQARCTPEDPFIRLSARDHETLMPGIVNGLSHHFAEGFMLDFHDQSVERYMFLLAVVFETDPSMRVRMTRVIVTDEAQLTQVVQAMADKDFADSVALSRPHHAKRLETLAQIARLHEKEKGYGPDELRLLQPFEAVVRKGQSLF